MSGLSEIIEGFEDHNSQDEGQSKEPREEISQEFALFLRIVVNTYHTYETLSIEQAARLVVDPEVGKLGMAEFASAVPDIEAHLDSYFGQGCWQTPELLETRPRLKADQTHGGTPG